MEQGHSGACRRKWRLTDTDLCLCGETQTMSHIAESCPLTKLNGGLSRLRSADEDAVSWLTNYGSWHAYEKKKKTVTDFNSAFAVRMLCFAFNVFIATWCLHKPWCLSVLFVYCVETASCYGMWIGNRTQAFNLYCCQLPLTMISRLRHDLTLNISEMVRNRHVTVEF